MSRGKQRFWRPVAVWLAVSAAAVTSAASAPGAWATASASTEVVDLFVAGCAVALAASLVWIWLVTTVTVAALVTGARPAGGGATRRMVLAACGVAVVAGASGPAFAADGDGPELLAGLNLPDRAVAPAQQPAPARPAIPPTVLRTASVAADDYVVRPGDSLWSIAAAHTDGRAVDEHWRAIWRANRDVVGDDPDLILPGQALRLPATDTSTDTSTDDEDGAR